jgi:enoyl-CoA hydratase
MAGEQIGTDSNGVAAPVLYERVGSAAVVTINREHRRNAVDGGTGDALEVAYHRFIEDDDALCMILTGAGDQAFCAGADLKNIASFAPRLMSDSGPMGFSRQIPPKPTIAAISGWALAGGFELALWCDLRICGEGTTFGFAERRWGVPLVDGGTQRLAPVVGLSRAMDLILSGRMVELDEAERIGLVSQRVPAGQHLTAALEYVERIEQFPRETMLADRSAMLKGLGEPLAEGLKIEALNGPAVAEVAASGAQQFSDGAGRGGIGV